MFGSCWVVFAILAGCVRQETLVIVPRTMAATLSRHNHAQGDAYVLRANGTMSARVKFRSVHRWRLEVTVRAEPGEAGTWPDLQIAIDGVLPQSMVVGERGPTSHRIDFVAEPGFADLKLSLLNAGTAGTGPSLVVERIQIAPSDD